jgi:outer membrane lipoprotein SlyB
MSSLRLPILASWIGCVVTSTMALPISGSRPSVEGFDLERVESLAVGVPLNFSVFGSPGAAVTLSIEGGGRQIDLPETRPGIYEGTYVLDGRDSVRADSRVVAMLQRDGQVARSTLAEPLLLEHLAPPWAGITTAQASPVPPRPGPPCADCAVVESMRTVNAPPRGGWAGSVTGAIAGAIIANQGAAARDRPWMRWLGALGGGLVGREVERQVARRERFEVVLRLPDGSALIRSYDSAPAFKTGDTVSVSGSLRSGARSAIY